jgi:transcriptional accessory protein Tex/SPT6
MPGDNLISIKIPSEQLAQIKTKVTELKELLAPYLIVLSGKEIRGLFKMNDGTIPFAEKCLNYVKDLSDIYRPLKELMTNLSSTITEAGSETLTPALAYYNSVKQAAKQNIPDAKTIYEDLKKRFEKGSSGNSEPEEQKS